MPRGVGIRWWLGLAFALVAATTAVAVAQVFSGTSEAAFRERAQALAAGRAFQAAIDLRHADAAADTGALALAAERVAEARGVSLFLFSPSGELLTWRRSRGVALADVPGRGEALRAALDGARSVTTDERLRATVVAIPLVNGDAAALVVYASHPDLAAGAGIVRTEIARAAGWALLLGASVGLALAWLVARRLRRIAAAARAIEQGDFDRPLTPDFGDEVGQLAATIDAMRDRLRESFARIEAQRDRFRLLLERQQDGVLALDRALRVTYSNRAASTLVGTLEGELVPDVWDGVLRRFATALFETREPVVEEDVAPDEDHLYRLSGVPPREGETALIVVADVSARERAERAEREFVTNAAHELRTPLTTILGAVEVLQSGAKHDSADRDRFLAHIEREAERLVRLTRALLVLARAQTKSEQPRLEPLRLAPVMEAVRAATRVRPGVVLDIECPPELAVRADRDLLEQALGNLAGNAAEHTTKGRVALAARRSDGRVVIDVSDTGDGIPAEVRDRVFERFFRADEERSGFGLGLSIVRQAVQALGGSVMIDGGPGEGTRVRVFLPAAEREG